MTAQPQAASFRPGKEIEDFYALRSELIDAFARLELAVNRCLNTLGYAPDPRKTTLGRRIAELSKAKPSPRLSKINAHALGTLPQDCEPLQRLRGAIVHGAMELGLRVAEPIALFRNVADIVADEPICHVLTRADFRRRIDEVQAMADRIERSLN
jgi:hypothetical protein